MDDSIDYDMLEHGALAEDRYGRSTGAIYDAINASATGGDTGSQSLDSTSTL